MRIKSIHLREVGPIGTYDRDLCDEWRKEVHDLVLLSGPNGCGKSTVLRTVAHLWLLTASWLATPGAKVKGTNTSRKWLTRWKAAGVIFDNVAGIDNVGLFWGEPSMLEELKQRSPDTKWIGQTRKTPEGKGRPPEVLLHTDADWIQTLVDGYRKSMLNGGGVIPNIVHLDGEERRWVSPTKGLGEIVSDDPLQRWLTSYRASEEWKGQLEASLIALKTIDEKKFGQVIRDLNSFLQPKTIGRNTDASTLRLHVELPMASKPGKAAEHSLDELSAGEHQILIQLYLISRWLEPNGVVMIDEPDLHLHPSLLQRFLDRLEALVQERKGQLILTSHNPDIWTRYEQKGIRIDLGKRL